MADLVLEDRLDRLNLRDAMDWLFEDSFITPRRLAPSRDGELDDVDLDVVENDVSVVVSASVPGFKAQDLDVSVEGDLLTIESKSKTEEKEQKGEYLLRERHHGAIRRSLCLPVTVQADKAKAEFRRGVLTLTLPKAERVESKPFKVALKSGSK